MYDVVDFPGLCEERFDGGLHGGGAADRRYGPGRRPVGMRL